MSLGVLDLTDDGREVAWPPRIVTGARAVGVRAWTVIQTVRGTWPPDQRLGLPWLDWSTPVPLVVVEGEVRTALARVRGVLEVVSVTARRIGTTLAIGAVLRVADVGGTAIVRVGDDPDEPAPGAWYLLVTRTGIRPVAPVRS